MPPGRPRHPTGAQASPGYKVQWKRSADSWDTEADVSETTVTGTAHTITGLTDGVEYTVRGQGGERCRGGSALGGSLRNTRGSTDMVHDLDGGGRRDIRRLHDIPAGFHRSGRSLVRHHHVGRRQLHREGPGGSGRQVDSLRDAKTGCRVCPRGGGRTNSPLPTHRPWRGTPSSSSSGTTRDWTCRRGKRSP